MVGCVPEISKWFCRVQAISKRWISSDDKETSSYEEGTLLSYHRIVLLNGLFAVGVLFEIYVDNLRRLLHFAVDDMAIYAECIHTGGMPHDAF